MRSPNHPLWVVSQVKALLAAGFSLGEISSWFASRYPAEYPNGLPRSTIRHIGNKSKRLEVNAERLARLEAMNQVAAAVEHVPPARGTTLKNPLAPAPAAPATPAPAPIRATEYFSPGSINIFVWPDPQVKPGIDLTYCARVGRRAADRRPDVILCGGDFADMPSLSSYDLPGSKGMEGQRYREDILSVQNAMRLFLEPINAAKAAHPDWNPRLIMLLGNHEDRIRRALEATPKLEGVIGMTDLRYAENGFEVIPFLSEITLNGVSFSHFFCSGVMGRPITTARALIQKKHMSCFAFHQQGRDIAFGQRADGKRITAIIAGSGYEHDEKYLNPQTNNHWRGVYELYNVKDGEFDEVAVPMSYLRRVYPQG